jgi:hypothetical protein
VAVSALPEVRHLAGPRDDRQPAGDAARCDQAVEVRRQPSESVLVEPDLTRLHLDLQLAHLGLLALAPPGG